MRLDRVAFVGLLGVASCAGATPPPAPPAPAPPPAPVTVAPPPPAPSVKGVWLGALHVGTHALRLQLRLDPADAARGCAVDSLDQHSPGIPCRYAPGAGDALSIDVPDVKGSWTGTLSADGQTLTGTWSQGGPGLPLVLTRQDKAIEIKKVEPQPAMPPVDVAALKPVLDADLAPALDRGDLAAATGSGVTVGVVQHGVRRVFSYGAAKPDAVFEIGSITKTFTGLLLAQLATQKKVRLDEPVRELLPAGTLARPESGSEITLLDLSDQHSGLPRMPDNFRPADPTNPYADYDEKALFAWLAGRTAARPKDAPFGYSNVGVGLLGDALVHRAGVPYEALLRQQITGPLGMKETVVALTPPLRARLAPGHDAEHKPARTWDLDALVGAGGIRSTAADMLIYVEAQLHPDKLPPGAAATPAGKTLPAALKESHNVRAEAGDRMQIALNWLRVAESGAYWHNGGTGGYSACVLFDPERDFGVVVLANTSPGEESFADTLAAHVAHRLKGLPAAPLGPQPE